MANTGVWSKSLVDVPSITGDILDRFVRKQSVGKQTSVRGYKFFLEGYLHDVEVSKSTAADDDDIHVRAKCYRSMRKNERPHNVSVVITAGGEPACWKCSCAAGQSLCHHTVGLVYQLQHYQKLGLRSVPPITSKTSKPQTWHVPPRTAGWKGRPVSEVTVQQPKRPKMQLSPSSKSKQRTVDGISSTVYNPLASALKDICLPRVLSPFFLSLETSQQPQFVQLWDCNGAVTEPLVESKFGPVPRGSVLSYQLQVACVGTDSVEVASSDLPPWFQLPDYTNFVRGWLPLRSAQHYDMYQSLQVSDIQSMDFEETTRSQADSTDWHRLRQQRLTASKFKEICSRRANFETLAARLKTTRSVRTAAMTYGIEHEPEAAEMYARTFARNVYRVGFVINPTCPFLGCSPDRRALDLDEPRNQWGLLEIKCTTAEAVTDCGFLHAPKSSGGKLQLKRNHAHYFQVIGQMGLTGSPWCDFFVFAKSNYHLERIYYDKEFFDEMLSKLLHFYFTYFLV